MRTKIQIKNRNLSYTLVGKGFPVVFIHGFCEELTMWDAFQPLDTSKHCILKIDLPGFGQSDVDEQVTIVSMANDVKAVLDQERISSCILIGHSMGGYVGLAFAAQYADYLKGFCLFHSHPYADTEETKLMRSKANTFIERHGSGLFVGQVLPKLFEENYLTEHEAFVNGLIAQAATFPPEGIRNANIAMRDRKDQSNVLADMSCPVLFIIGDQDYAVPMALNLKMIPLPSIASIHILRDCGHMGMYERKSETQEIVKRFVSFCHR